MKISLQRILGGGESWLYPVDETGHVYWELGFHEDDTTAKKWCQEWIKTLAWIEKFEMRRTT